MDFLKTFTSGRYQRDIKILKILASNSSGSEFMAFLKNDKLMMIGGGGQIQHFFRKLLLKITYGLKNSPGYIF